MLKDVQGYIRFEEKVNRIKRGKKSNYLCFSKIILNSYIKIIKVFKELQEIIRIKFHYQKARKLSILK